MSGNHKQFDDASATANPAKGGKPATLAGKHFRRTTRRVRPGPDPADVVLLDPREIEGDDSVDVILNFPTGLATENTGAKLIPVDRLSPEWTFIVWDVVVIAPDRIRVHLVNTTSKVCYPEPARMRVAPIFQPRRPEFKVEVPTWPKEKTDGK